MANSYEHLTVTIDDGVAVAVIDNPPINLFSRELFIDMSRFAEDAENDDGIRVVVLRSANDDFFIAHFDVSALLDGCPSDEPA